MQVNDPTGKVEAALADERWPNWADKRWPSWPVVLREFETMQRLVDEGLSLARYGDGELGCTDGQGYNGQEMRPGLKEEMREILLRPHPRCLPAIPTMDERSPRFAYWLNYQDRFRKLIDQRRVYGSAFIGCRAKAPWIDTDEYVNLMRSLWVGKRHVCVLPADIDMVPWMPDCLEFVHCPKLNAYDTIDKIEAQVVSLKPDVVTITAGPMATCLANRLAGHGIQGVDLGRAIGLLTIHSP